MQVGGTRIAKIGEIKTRIGIRIDELAGTNPPRILLCGKTVLETLIFIHIAVSLFSIVLPLQ